MTRADAHRATIDYGRPFAEMVAAGAYDHVNEYTTEANFPVIGHGVATIALELVCLEVDASTEKVVRELESSGSRLGRIAELLALGAAQPELQRSFPIVALGSVASYPSDYRRIPFLWGSPRVRHLDLRWDEHSWGGNIRFLTVRDG